MKEYSTDNQSDVSNIIVNVVEEIKCWIQLNLDKKITVKSVSSRAGYSRWYFQRRFREITGTGLSDFILKTRLDDALNDITMTCKSFVDIAEQHGFGSIHTFIRATRKFYHMTPSEIRERIAEKPDTVASGK